MVNQFGEVITKEGAEAIRQRQERKAALLADMREQRVTAGLDRQSHVGAELGRVVPDGGLQHQLRKTFAELSNLLMVEGYDEGAAILASLARGIDRAAHELFGVSEAGDTELAYEATVRAKAIRPKDDPATVVLPGPDDISQEPQTTYPKPEPQKPLTKDDATYPTAEPLATFEDDDPEDMPGADEESVSPEPQETPARAAARQRRQAKRAPKDN